MSYHNLSWSKMIYPLMADISDRLSMENHSVNGSFIYKWTIFHSDISSLEGTPQVGGVFFYFSSGFPHQNYSLGWWSRSCSVKPIIAVTYCNYGARTPSVLTVIAPSQKNPFPLYLCVPLSLFVSVAKLTFFNQLT